MEKPKHSLWTYDFTVITIGSVISMVGGEMAGFAVSLVVLDHTGSTFLYTLFNVCFQLPMLICPVLAGPYLDRMSRKRVIYTLDFTSSVLFLGLFLLLRSGWFSYPLMLAGCVIMGAIFGVYQVAYESFYPNLITEGNFRKAYSVSSMLFPLAAMSAPIASALYYKLGSAAPIFAINSACFFTAACFERSIRHKETHIDTAPPADGLGAMKRFDRDLREGLTYIRSEKGLLYICLYFMTAGVCWAGGNLALPYFKNHPENFAAWPLAAATLYAVVSNFSVVGRLTGGLFQYRIPIPREKRFVLSMMIYVITGILIGTEMFLPIPLMALAYFVEGLLSVISYTIRTAAIQSYVPDSKRARFNGVSSMMMSLGSIVGNLTAGALGEYFTERSVILGMNLMGLVMIYVFIYRGRDHVRKIYNQDI